MASLRGTRRHVRPSTTAALVGVLAHGVAGSAVASPWLATPSAQAGLEYQSNPSFVVGGGTSASYASLGLGLPTRWESGRYALGVNPNVLLRGGRGAGAGPDTNDVSFGLDGTRGGERVNLQANFAYRRSDLLGPSATEVGLDRSGGTDSTTEAGAGAAWAISEYDSANLAASWRVRRFGSGASGRLVDSRDRSLGVSYARALSPRWSLLAAYSQSSYRPEEDLPESETRGLQVGFSLQASPQWFVRATAGRSRARYPATGASFSGSVYDVLVSRALERGGLVITASQSLDGTAFGSLAKRRAAALSWSLPISERLAFEASAQYAENREVFAGFRVDARSSESLNLGASYAVSEFWSLGLGARATRERAGANTFGRPSGPDATSYVASVSVARRFGSFDLFRELP